MRDLLGRLMALPSRWHASPALRRAFASVGWLTAGQVLVLGLSLAVTTRVARYLHPDRFGQLAFAVSLVSIMMGLAVLGSAKVIARELVSRKDQADRILGSAFALWLAAALVTAGGLVTLAAVWPTAWPAPSMLIIVAALGLLPHSFILLRSWFSARVEAHYIVMAQLTGVGLAALARLAAVEFQLPLITFGWIFTLALVVEAILLLVFYRMTGGRVTRWRFDAGEARHLLSHSWPMLIASVAVAISLRVDQVMIGVMRGDSALGLYTAAVFVAEVLNFLPHAVGQSVMPALIELRAQHRELYERRGQLLVDLLTWSGIGLALSIAAVGPWVVPLVFGPAYAGASMSLAILAFGSVFVFPGVMVTVWAVVEESQRAEGAGKTAAAVINVTLNLLLIPRWGIEGAACASVVSYAAAAFVPGLISPRMRPTVGRLLRAYNAPVRWLAMWRRSSEARADSHTG